VDLRQRRLRMPGAPTGYVSVSIGERDSYINAHRPLGGAPVSHEDEENIVGDGVDDAVVTDSIAQTGTTLQRAGSRRPRVLCQ